MTGHDRYLELAATAIDFELGGDERRELDDHLAGCRACRRAIEELSAEARSLASLPTAAAPERVRRTVLGAAERAMSGRVPGRTDDRPVRRLPALRVALVAGLAVAPLVLAVVLLRDLDFGLGFASSGAGGGAPPGQIAWTRLEPGPGESTAPGASGAPVAGGPATLVAVAATPNGGVAVGHACGTETVGCRAVAAIVDGDVIRLAPADDGLDVEPLPDGSSPGMRDIVRVSGGFVAVGATGHDGRPVAVAWRSGDGLHWVRAPDSPALAGGWMNAVAEAGDGSLVAVGGALRADGTAVAATWTSTDGMAWIRAADAPALTVGPADQVVTGRPVVGMWDVAWVGDRLVAVGADCRAGGAACTATAWTSSRGTGWSRLPAEGFGPGRAASVVALDGAAAVVGRGMSSAISWRLGANGTVTQRALQPNRVTDLLAAASSGGRAVAAGTPGTKAAGIWVTSDGDSWAFYGDDLLRRATILGIALDGDRAIAVGDADGGPGSIWIGRLEGVEP